MADDVTLADIEAASVRLRDVIRDLPLAQARWLDDLVGGDVRLVTENLQRAGSFKIRGAYNRISQLSDDEKAPYGLTDADLAFAAKKQELVTQGRNLRREANIPGNKRVKFVLKPLNEAAPHDAAVLKILLNADPLDLDPYYQPPKGTPTAPTPLGDLYLPLEGLVDVAAEKARLTKEIGKIDAEITKVEANLNNPAFVQKVPPAVLETHRGRLAEFQTKRARLQEALAALGG